MNERLVSRVVIGLSLALIAAEAVLIAVYGLRMEIVLLPFIVFLAALGLLFGIASMRGMRSDIESVSMRRERAMKDELVRKRLEGYEVDEEFLPGSRKNKKPPLRPSGTAAPVSAGRQPGVRPSYDPQNDPFEQVDSKLLELAPSFGGFRQMIAAIEAMDNVSYKRLLYSLNMEVVDQEEFVRPLKEAAARAGRSGGPLRQELDHGGMEEYIKAVLAGRDGRGESSGRTFSLDPDDGMPAGLSQPPEDFSHKPRAVIDQFKRSMKRP
ncbi:hypothetical protein CR163_009600 [Prosthecochloris sp. ZM_2]|uniref:hypothetical protein n=1 Tax=Prosthecochloris sp. ZM_2 TaxID=2045206 RepID=UPI000DF74628|nr:hypothetical protein [Prosthecochloris sp. ZM_2]RNA65445.1 hypothetical protein CR163_009600 [Prosthecochloris sp. ZM_2]